MKKALFFLLILSLTLVALGVLSACSPAPIGIIVKTSPKSKTVPQGGVPDLTGGVVTVSYEDGTSKDVPMTDLEVRGLNSAETGKQTLVLVYTEGGKSFSATMEVTVALAKAKRIELSTENVKTTYFTGDNFDRTGLVVTAYYETGATAVVTSYELSPTRLVRSTSAVTVSYRGARATIPVTVLDKAPSSLLVTTPPTKTTYYMGESFESDGMVATVTYNDGTTESFAAADLTYTHPSGGAYDTPFASTDNVVVVTAKTSLGEISADLKITVLEVLPVELVATVTEGELTFFEGEPFSFGEAGNVIVRVRYNNGDVEDLVATDDLFSYEGERLAPGQSTVEITFLGYDAVKASVPVSVRPIGVTSIEILVAPKTEYAVGDAVDLTGLILLVTKENGDRMQFVWQGEGVTFAPSFITSDIERIVVTYEGCEASFDVTVA